MRPIRLTALAALASLSLCAAAMAQTATPSTAPAPVTTPAPAMAPRSVTPAPMLAKVPDSALVDINSATRQQLDDLPQIGAARADAIVKGRPYRVKTDLVTRKVIPQNAYDAIQSRIVARQG